ncbi:MAG: hypothetical protein ACOC70_00510 [bacterium]
MIGLGANIRTWTLAVAGMVLLAALGARAAGGATPDGPLAAPEVELTEEQQAALAAMRVELARRDRAVRDHRRQLEQFPRRTREEVVEDWAGAARKLVVLLARYDQEGACLTELATFRRKAKRGERGREIFERAALRCARTFKERHDAPHSAMRIASRYGPRSVDLGEAWGRLAEACARQTGERRYKIVALESYAKAVVVDITQTSARRRMHALERELFPGCGVGPCRPFP